MAENSEAIPTGSVAAGVPWRLRTLLLGAAAVAVLVCSLASAFGEVFLTLPQYGFVSFGEGSIAFKLPEKAPPGAAVDAQARPGHVRVGREWPLAQRYFVGTDPIPRNVQALTSAWYQSPRIWWKPDLTGFPVFSRWPLWMPAAALMLGCIGLRALDIRRWRMLARCPHCGYSLAGLEELEGSDAPCPECGKAVPALAR